MVVHSVSHQLPSLCNTDDMRPLQVVNIYDHRMALHPWTVVPVLQQVYLPAAGLFQDGARRTFLQLELENLIAAIQCHDLIHGNAAALRDSEHFLEFLRIVFVHEVRIIVAPLHHGIPRLVYRLLKLPAVSLDRPADQRFGLLSILDTPGKWVASTQLNAKELVSLRHHCRPLPVPFFCAGFYF